MLDDLYLHLAQDILPRLREFRKINRRFPDRMNLETWEAKIDGMIMAFFYIVADGRDTGNEYDTNTPQQIEHIIEHGLKDFAKYYQELWY